MFLHQTLHHPDRPPLAVLLYRSLGRARRWSLSIGPVFYPVGLFGDDLAQNVGVQVGIRAGYITVFHVSIVHTDGVAVHLVPRTSLVRIRDKERPVTGLRFGLAFSDEHQVHRCRLV
jgi:hypothetical protein